MPLYSLIRPSQHCLSIAIEMWCNQQTVLQPINRNPLNCNQEVVCIFWSSLLLTAYHFFKIYNRISIYFKKFWNSSHTIYKEEVIFKFKDFFTSDTCISYIIAINKPYMVQILLNLFTFCFRSLHIHVYQILLLWKIDKYGLFIGMFVGLHPSFDSSGTWSKYCLIHS